METVHKNIVFHGTIDKYDRWIESLDGQFSSCELIEKRSYNFNEDVYVHCCVHVEIFEFEYEKVIKKFKIEE